VGYTVAEQDQILDIVTDHLEDLRDDLLEWANESGTEKRTILAYVNGATLADVWTTSVLGGGNCSAQDFGYMER